MILGYERQIRYLDATLRRGRLAHAYLFYGPDAAGGLAVAKAVAKALVCQARQSPGSIAEAGDECRDCRLVEGNIHPDAAFLDVSHPLVAAEEDRREVSIDDIRELKRRFSLAVSGGRWRIAILNQADRMSSKAADAFLKLLEEPGERTLFLLTASSREILPPTIISRVVPIGFESVSGAEQSPEDKELLLSLVAARSGGIPALLALAENLAGNPPRRSRALRMLAWELRAELHRAENQFLRLAAARRIRRMLDIAHLMETVNVNPRLAMDVLLLETKASLV